MYNGIKGLFVSTLRFDGAVWHLQEGLLDLLWMAAQNCRRKRNRNSVIGELHHEVPEQGPIDESELAELHHINFL